MSITQISLGKDRKGKELYLSSRSSAGALIGDTATEINTAKSNFGFSGEGKPEYPEKTSRCRVENQQTQPTFDTGSGNRTQATLVGGECSHYCAIPALRHTGTRVSLNA